MVLLMKGTEMITFKTGDILTEDSEALVNTVNCVGIMGRGIALQFKKAFPLNFKAYELACRRGEVQPGRMFVYETQNLTNPKYIINFPTKRHWRGKSHISDIDSGLRALIGEIRSRDIKSLALPPLGSGLGGLDWNDIRPRIVQALDNIPGLRVVVFEPTGSPDERSKTKASDYPEMTPGRASLIGLMDSYLAGLMDPFVTLLEVHKLMYFMQEAGQPLRLRYVEGFYGPYAENLRHALKAIEGYFISGYADGGDAPDKRLQLVPGAIGDARVFLEDHPEVRARFDRVTALVEGFETPFGLELLSTVHWVSKHRQAETIDDLINKTYAWGDRKRQFSERQLLIALDRLIKEYWINRPLRQGIPQ
jgi:O-acetyl-ADP-ribose deacetylase (regulator of RNase III)